LNIDPSSLSEGRRYFLLISCLIPRPIAWAATVNEMGNYNLAPFSFFNAFSATPPVIGIGFGMHEHKPEKDTLRNIRRSGELTVNLATVELAEKLYESSLDLPYGESEFERCGLTPAPALSVAAPLVAEAPVSFECRLLELKPLGEGGSTLMLAQIVQMHIRETLFDYRGNVDPHRFNALARLGAGTYAALDGIFKLPRE
jgi:flavin reductase (DIM6/NTAB) family NADH-FMN oxidoreductase RutF